MEDRNPSPTDNSQAEVLDDKNPEPADQPVAKTAEPETAKSGSLAPHWRHWHRAKAWYGGHKKWSIPLTIVILLAIVGGVPWTRYQLAGLVLKDNFSLQVTDSSSNTPVSGATVTIGAVSGTTDGSGKVTLRAVKVGRHEVSVSKKYYSDKNVSLLIPLLKQKTTPNILFVATGRQVKIKITNLINTNSLSGVEIQVADTTAKTGTDGTATVVLPASSSSQKATLSLAGYNDAAVVVKISDKDVQENDFTLTPTGKIYFLSKSTGQLDVMKANLDGSDAQVAVAATGNEEDGNTFVLESPDGNYVALVAKRTTTDATPQLYVLAAADDKLLQVDSGDANFSMTGWIGDSLIYTTSRQDLPFWQQGLNKLKSYDATSGRTTLLDESAGSDATTDANENYATVIISGNSVIYGKIWNGSAGSPALTGKQDSLQIIDFDGQNHQAIATYPAGDIVQFVQHSPVGLYISDESADLTTTTYYDYTAAGVPKQVSLSSAQVFANNYTYLFSPSGNQTFWSEPRDGKYALIVADGSGQSPKTIQNLTDYSAYGWYTDNYLLVSKNSSELYIMDTRGGTPIKVTDYEPSFGGF